MGNGKEKSLAISIHAPAKGATSLNGVSIVWIEISIHAPAKGATLAYNIVKDKERDFNPRSREGSDKNVYAGAC